MSETFRLSDYQILIGKEDVVERYSEDTIPISPVCEVPVFVEANC